MRAECVHVCWAGLKRGLGPLAPGKDREGIWGRSEEGSGAPGTCMLSTTTDAVQDRTMQETPERKLWQNIQIKCMASYKQDSLKQAASKSVT